MVKPSHLSKPSHLRTNSLSSFILSPKFFIYLLSICAILFIFFHIQSLHAPPPSQSSSWPTALMHQLQRAVANSTAANCTQDPTSMAATKLRRSVTFLPLKDLRYAHKALDGHTWFMSSMYDTHREGDVQYQEFPSPASDGRLLCLKGRDTHDGSWNYYALAWPEALPENATFKKGLTFVSYNHYNYDNIWHGLSAVMPFVAWHQIQGNCEVPDRWILYHWGELRLKMGTWLRTLMEATFGGPPSIEAFEEVGEGQPVCFEKAVVMRHNEGGMSRQRRMETYDLMRCKARLYCNVISPETQESGDGAAAVGMTLFMRTGARSFKNETAVVEIFGEECAKVAGCRLTVAHSNNLTFCEQVGLMRKTDILASPHGAQLTNLFLMDRNSSVMEFFPKGWLKLAGIGQFVYHWMASWSGMRHQGDWRDPDGQICPFSEDDRRCMSIYKSGTIGYNRTHFSEWAKSVLNEVKMRKIEEAAQGNANHVLQCSCN